jgi:hypothetical protein
MIVRDECQLDPQIETGNGPVGNYDNPESFRHLNAFSFWLFVETGINNSSPQESTYSEFILMYEMMRDVFNLANMTVTIKNTINLQLSFKKGRKTFENESSIMRSAISHDTADASDITMPAPIPTYQQDNPMGNR